MKNCILVSVCFLVLAGTAFAADIKPHTVGPKDKCATCGMFVSKYPDFKAQVQFRDGSTFHFDGAKDMFKYCLNLPRYAPGRKSADITALFVTDYYDLTMIDGRKAVYVIGSDVYGPMGRELIPFAGESRARDFLKDHHGNKIVRFNDVTSEIFKLLD